MPEEIGPKCRQCGVQVALVPTRHKNRWIPKCMHCECGHGERDCGHAVELLERMAKVENTPD